MTIVEILKHLEDDKEKLYWFDKAIHTLKQDDLHHIQFSAKEETSIIRYGHLDPIFIYQLAKTKEEAINIYYNRRKQALDFEMNVLETCRKDDLKTFKIGERTHAQTPTYQGKNKK